MSKLIREVDVIAEFKSDHTIIPMRFRIMNEDGEYMAYTLRSYRQITNVAGTSTKDGLFVCSGDHIFEGKVLLNGVEQLIRLYFLKNTCSWVLGF